MIRGGGIRGGGRGRNRGDGRCRWLGGNWRHERCLRWHVHQSGAGTGHCDGRGSAWLCAWQGHGCTRQRSGCCRLRNGRAGWSRHGQRDCGRRTGRRCGPGCNRRGGGAAVVSRPGCARCSLCGDGQTEGRRILALLGHLRPCAVRRRQRDCHQHAAGRRIAHHSKPDPVHDVLLTEILPFGRVVDPRGLAMAQSAPIRTRLRARGGCSAYLARDCQIRGPMC